MNIFFKKGFLKVADPQLASDSNQGDHWDTQEEYRYKRQQLLERYSTSDPISDKKEKQEKLFPKMKEGF